MGAGAVSVTDQQQVSSPNKVRLEIDMKLTIVLLFAVLTGYGMVPQAADEQEFETWMKTVNATMGSLRTGLQGKAADTVAKDAATLGGIFKKCEEFWKRRQKDDAVDWSKKASAAALEIEAAAKASDFDKAGAGARNLFGTCAGCHNSYRERGPDGSYRFKQPTAAGASSSGQSTNVTGTWNMTVETQAGSGNPTFILKQEGETITGTYKGQFGEAPVKGTIKGNEIKFTVKVDAQGQQLEIEYAGTVDGNTMKGKVKLGDLGEGTFTGKKA